MAAVRDELRATGSFDAERVGRRAGCAPATYYAHLSTKDDALGAAFALVLNDLVALVVRHVTFQPIGDLRHFCAVLVGDLVDFFGEESLVFRAALARAVDHRGIRRSYRAAEREALSCLRACLAAAQVQGHVTDATSAAALADAVLVQCQGLNNAYLLGREDRDAVLGLLAEAMTQVLRPR